MNQLDVLNALKSKSSAKVAKTLDAIYLICDEQRAHGSIDFSYAMISKLGRGKGVPKVQSIRNSTGENYRTLIQAFSATAKPYTSTERSKSGDGWVEDIKDLRLRLLVNMKLAELAEANRLIKEFVPPGLEIRIDDRQGPQADFRFDEVERRALEYLISPDFLAMWRFKLGSIGDILDQNGKRVFKPMTIDAIKKALQHL
ncbi:gamma-mobile-trio protein GmtX [Pseudomonas azerbaijanoccidentalis]